MTSSRLSRLIQAITLPLLIASPTTQAQQITELVDLPRLQLPSDVALGVGGEVYVAGIANVMRVTSTGEVTDVFDGNLDNHDREIAIDLAGNLFVTDHVLGSLSGAIRVLRVDPSGAIAVVYPDDFSSPILTSIADLITDSTGTLYVASKNKVHKVTPAGVISTAWTAPDTVTGIALDASDQLHASWHDFADDTTQVVRLSSSGVPTVLIDNSGDGRGHLLQRASGLCIDPAGNLFVAGGESDNVFQVAPDGTITQIMDATGDGGLWPLDGPWGLFLDDARNLYVGTATTRVFRRSPGGTVTSLMGPYGMGVGAGLLGPGWSFTVAGDGTIYLAGFGSDNLYRVAPDGFITELVPKQSTLANLSDMKLLDDGTLFVSGAGSHNVMRVESDGTTSIVFKPSQLPPTISMKIPTSLAIGGDGSLYLGASKTNNVLRIPPTGTITEVVDQASGFLDCSDVALDDDGELFSAWSGTDEVVRTSASGTHSSIISTTDPDSLVFDAAGNLYTASLAESLVLRTTPAGVTTIVLDAAGDGVYPLNGPSDLALTSDGVLFVTGAGSDNVFRVATDGSVTQVMDASGDGLGNTLDNPTLVVTDSQGNAYVDGLVAVLNFNFRTRLFQISQTGVVTLVMDETGDGQGKTLRNIEELGVDGQDRLYVADSYNNKIFRVDLESTWKDLGGASPPGVNGVPKLSVAGSLVAGSVMDRTLENAAPNTLLLAWLSFSSAPLQALGGTVHAYPPSHQWFFATDAAGESSLALTWPASIPPAIDLYIQFLVQDASVPAGLTLSNAVTATTP